eukprot:gene67266-92150_t
MPITLIANASWIVAYDAKAKGHVYLRDGDVAYDGDRIVHVGGTFKGKADVTLDGRGGGGPGGGRDVIVHEGPTSV